MATDDVIELFDLSALLQPISDAHPVGENLREDISPSSLYYQVKDQRTEARMIERRNLQEDEQEDTRAYWQKVCELSLKILQQHSKDLEISAWFIEALVRRYQFKGLAFGFTLVSGLIERYWDTLYPIDADEPIVAKVSALGGLNGFDADGTLIFPLQQIPITQEGEYPAYLFWQYQQVLEARDAKGRLAEEVVDLAKFNQAITASGSAFYQTLVKDLKAAEQALQHLTQLLDERCGKDSPPSSNLKAVLRLWQDYLGYLFKDHPDILLDKPEEIADTTQSTPTVPAATAANLNATIHSREQALQLLQKVSSYFSRTEPHSPIPYVLQRAARWARLSYAELMEEIINDQKVLDSVQSVTGIKTSE